MNESNKQYNSLPEEEDSWDQRWEEKWSDRDKFENEESDEEHKKTKSDFEDDSESSMESYKLGMEGFSLAIIASCLMVLPGVLGSWLDHYFQMNFLGLTGIISGMILAIAYLLISQNRLGAKVDVKKESSSGKADD